MTTDPTSMPGTDSGEPDRKILPKPQTSEPVSKPINQPAAGTQFAHRAAVPLQRRSAATGLEPGRPGECLSPVINTVVQSWTLSLHPSQCCDEG
ncbi:unnamed protein product [Merluccius merluccius]